MTSQKQLYAKINLMDYSVYVAKSFWDSPSDPLKAYLREVGAEKFTFENPSFFGRILGWVEVPGGTCLKINL